MQVLLGVEPRLEAEDSRNVNEMMQEPAVHECSALMCVGRSEQHFGLLSWHEAEAAAAANSTLLSISVQL